MSFLPVDFAFQLIFDYYYDSYDFNDFLLIPQLILPTMRLFARSDIGLLHPFSLTTDDSLGNTDAHRSSKCRQL